MERKNTRLGKITGLVSKGLIGLAVAGTALGVAMSTATVTKDILNETYNGRKMNPNAPIDPLTRERVINFVKDFSMEDNPELFEGDNSPQVVIRRKGGYTGGYKGSFYTSYNIPNDSLGNTLMSRGKEFAYKIISEPESR